MKVKKPTKRYKTIDIGPLDSYQKLGPGIRSSTLAMKHVICNACRGRFTEEDVMILGFKKHDIKGVAWGMRFHERCWDGTGKEVRQTGGAK